MLCAHSGGGNYMFHQAEWGENQLYIHIRGHSSFNLCTQNKKY